MLEALKAKYKQVDKLIAKLTAASNGVGGNLKLVPEIST